MCGISGFVGSGDSRDLEAMSDALVHRGPDGFGVFSDPDSGVFLAHRRLAILDMAGGYQPMWNENERVCVVFNGEIYNHLELRNELISKGHTFRSNHSDTEVLVHGYEEWGHDLPLRLNGMFAFAIYDRDARRLFLCRDRFGKKPLYYAAQSGLFVFASELTALLKHRGVVRRVDERSLQKYFAYGFIPAPSSLYQGISKLPGGHRLIYDVTAGTIAVSRYWQFRIEPTAIIPPKAEEIWGEELRHLISQAVRRRLVSDVPLGIFLSGGIDSSAVAAFAIREVPASQVLTFSIGFQEKSFDEAGFARRVATHFGTEHAEEVFSMKAATDLVPTVLAKLDEPMGDSSILPTYMLCRFARQRVTVALGGDGADELFAGYDPFRALSPATMYNRIVPGWLHRRVRPLVDLLPVSERNMSFEFRLKRGLRGVSYPPSVWNPSWLGALEPSDLIDLFHRPVSVDEVFEEAIDAWNSSTADNPVDKTLEFYCRFYLQDDILTKVDRASMMVSLEVRAPFLDNDVVEFARRIPHQYKIRNGQTKYLLKKTLEAVIPKDIVYRRKKGFGVPVTRWLKEWKQPDTLLQHPAPDKGWVDRQWEEHRSGRKDNRLFLWSWIVLQNHLALAGSQYE